MHPRPASRTLFAILLLSLSLVGCLGSGETVEVTQRPTPPPAADLPEEELSPEPEASAYLAAPYDTVRAGRFDRGKMWTFDAAPAGYFEDEYGLNADSAWFAQARLGALRFATYCSASFASPHGLIITNHHCARESITSVSEEGEALLENGFYAETMDEERRVPDLYVEQLIEIGDVTEQVQSALEEIGDDETRARVLQQTIERIETQRTRAAEQREEGLRVEVVELYNGGRYSAYTFNRYENVFLVMAPEEEVAYFGGDTDNFTYPRYALDFTFFRAYDDTGDPLQSEHYFPWHAEGTQVGDAVFVVGNPGSTSRMSTVSQLEFQRDYALPQELDVLNTRSRILAEFVEERPEEAEQYDLENTLFSVNNSIKASQGQLEGLRDRYLLARRAAAERDFRQLLSQNDSLQQRYGHVLDDVEALQRSKEAATRQAGAFTGFGSPSQTSHILLRGLYGYLYGNYAQRGAPPERLQELREEALDIEDWPRDLEQQYIEARLRELRRYLGPQDPSLRGILGGRSIEEVAEDVASNSMLADSTAFADLLDRGYLQSDDASVPLLEGLAPLYFTLGRQLNEIDVRERKLNAQLARARFAVLGTEAPPDATFSLRISDGVVRGYPYNGTTAPAYTTFFGLYNHYYTYGPDSEWALPEQWLSPPEAFRLATPLDLVSTNDITGGNSGSPLLNSDLELVGLIFDGNIESLPNEYLYSDARARAISVDVRGIQEALDDIYDADRIVQELIRMELVEREEDADESIGETE